MVSTRPTGTELVFTRASTLGSMLLERAEGPQAQDLRLLFVGEEDTAPRQRLQGPDDHFVLSYAQTLELARRGARHLQRRGVNAGDRVPLMLPTGPSFLAAFYGCQILGAIPVPLIPPTDMARMDDHLGRVARVARICEARAAVISATLVPVFRVAHSRFRDARRALSNLILGRDLLLETEALADLHPARAEDPAMIQFTSGSTGDPKGVVLPHASLLANMRGIGLGGQFRNDDVCLSWLPLHHDMGLIGHFLASLAWGMPLVLMPPETFIRRPTEWLKAISRYRASCSAAPNFAYSLCTKKVHDRDLEEVDLSCWRIAFCGAEPINAETLKQFSQRFRRHGFQASAFFPVYGMAEFSLAVTFPPPGRPPRFDRIRRARLERSGIAEPVGDEEGQSDAFVAVSVGSPLPGGHEIRVVDTQGRALPDRRVGEIEVRGPSMMSGYYQAPEATAEAIRNGWLRSGDLGYVAGGELYITGRKKELIIKGGKNLYPQDLEAAAAKVAGIRVGCCAAFGVTDQRRDTEVIVLVCETRAQDPQARAQLVSGIRAACVGAIGTAPDRILLVAPGTVPKTSSGKIQRDLMRRRYAEGDLRPGQPARLTVLRLMISAALARVSELAAPLSRRKAAASRPAAGFKANRSRN